MAMTHIRTINVSSKSAVHRLRILLVASTHHVLVAIEHSPMQLAYMLSVVRFLGQGPDQEGLCQSSVPVEMVPFADQEDGRHKMVDVTVVATSDVGIVGA
jgi:hypothetical protein